VLFCFGFKTLDSLSTLNTTFLCNVNGSKKLKPGRNSSLLGEAFLKDDFYLFSMEIMENFEEEYFTRGNDGETSDN